MKKITKFLDSVMGGIKRTCVAKALAVFAVASVTTSSFAQTLGGANSVINGVEDFKGLTLKEVQDASTSTNFSFADKAKVLFLYNVGTGKFLNVGGYWGTCAGLHDYGKALWVDYVNSKFKFTVNNSNDTGNTLGFLLGDSETDNGVFVDRGNASGETAFTNWTIEAVPNDAQNTVWIYTEKSDASSIEDAKKIGKYYLSANPDYNGTNKVCDAYKDGKKDGKELGENSEWRIFTYAQIYKAQHDGVVDNMKNALDLSFRLMSPNFERHDGDIKYWKTYDFVSGNQNEDGFAKFGLEKYYVTSALWNKTEAEKTWKPGYKFDYSEGKKTFDDVHDYQRYLGKYFCGSITGKCGILYQDIDITLSGTYVIECKGYSNTTKAKLFAGVLDPANKNKMVNGTMNSTMFNQVSNMSEAEQTALHTNEHNMDYAGKALYDNLKYMNSVVLTVPESAFYKNGSETDKYEKITIRLGVMTGEYSKVVAPADDEWTVFDDFRLQYASTNTDQDLILDEMRDNLNYLVNGSDKYENATLHLNKTLTKNKWNSLVLPVNLTKYQLQSTFGANTRLAKLNTLTPTSIEFKTVDFTGKADDYVALEANKPYIIFPEKDKTESNSASYTAILNVKNEKKKVNVPAGHYTIAKVKNVDFSNIKTEDWTTKLVDAADGSIAAYGTFARTFGEYTEKDEDGTYSDVTSKGKIIKGRPTLVNCYFFDKGNMYHSATRPRGLRGFSCWLQPTTTSGAQHAQLTIDGVSQGTTGIEDILADYEQPVSRFANGIYNLNGQLVKQGNSTAGLPSGMYIVNGKKCIVR